MILHRITEHVKTQNWTAVALDFVIVVVGVFIGIQVSNWNQARSEAALERTLLESLHGDFEAISMGDRERFERTVRAPENLAQLISHIRSGKEPPASKVTRPR